MLVSLEIPPVLNVSNHPILLYTTACLGFGLSAPQARPRNYYFLLPCGQFLRLLLFIISIHLSTDFTRSSFLGVVPLPHIRVALCLCLRISIALWPYAIVVFTHSFYYYYGFFLERMSGASTHIPLFIIYTITTALSKNDPSAYRIPRISPVPANDFILRMSHITSRNTTLPPCLIPLMSHITSHQTTPLRCPLSHPFIITTALQKNNIGALCVHGHISHPIPHYLHLGI